MDMNGGARRGAANGGGGGGDGKNGFHRRLPPPRPQEEVTMEVPVAGAAAAVPPAGTTLVDLNALTADMLQCQGCQQVYSEPCVLGCYHTCCAKCIRRKTDTVNRLVMCPVCG